LQQIRQIPKSALLFVENSAADLGDFKRAAEIQTVPITPVEVMSLDQNDHPRELGKGHGEFRMLDSALTTSPLATEHEYVVKLTGRLNVRNLVQIVRNMAMPFDLCGDVHPYRGAERGVVDSRLILFSRDFYRGK